MDEHPGGGGVGMAASRQQPSPQQGNNNTVNPTTEGGGGAVMVQQQQDEMPRPQQYTIPGILHYIQHEWARFEMERAHWEVERAELQARIAFLQGERKEETKDTDAPVVPQNSQLTWKQGRQLLRQYLQEVGYTDTILDVRSQRVRSLLGLSGSEQNGSVETKNLEQILNGGDAPSKQKGQDVRRNTDVLETFNFLENADDSDEEEDEEGDMVDDISDRTVKQRINKHKIKIGNEGLASDLPDDPDTEEALKEFDFLVTAEDGEGAGEARSSGDGTEWAEPLPFPSGGGKSFIMGSDDVLESVLGLGDLADLTVSNDEAEYNYDLPANKDAFRKTWNPKYTLRSHFDGVRALAFHPVEPVLVTVGPVLSLAVSSSGEQCFSGGIDSTIQWWNIPSSNVDPYDTYDPGVLAGTLLGHTDAVWGLAYSGIKNRLLSCSADGTVRLWNPPEKSPCIATYNADKVHGIPTAVDFNGCDPAHMVASFNTGSTVIYDLETSQPAVVFTTQSESALPAANHINRVVSHPTLPVTITAHEDRHIKFFDNKTGKLIHAMVAHLDAVTSLAVDPNGIYLMSGSHDCSIRLWNLDSKTCVQEITAHRKKSDESIYDVAFHPSKAYIASAGADALAKVFV
ncbi:hypothetical protein JZ751_002709 [Albula glossodonta]|uniref:Striatin N-terminal domain-containing protein n=1 Tax=Albula glossodonta TaxID=121402 RepID=A0A8T2NF92_9TELE|nr:hypothetical protein JZ751_002709 [Albula glossodonta]